MPTTPIAGLAVSDTITLTDIPYDSAGTATLNSANDVLTVIEGGTSYALQLAGESHRRSVQSVRHTGIPPP